MAGYSRPRSAGLRAAFGEANERGGVNGRLIRLLSDDDAYEPENCVECTDAMLNKRGVFALAGYVGTPTAKVAVPMAEELGVPLVGVFSGAVFLRQPPHRYVLNMRASYDDEMEALVKHFTGGDEAPRIAALYQNDSFGLSGLQGLEKALARRNMKLAAKGSFERNTTGVRSGLARILVGTPDVVIIIAPYQPAAEFIRAAHESGLQARFATISFVGIESLMAELGSLADGVIVSQVVPSPLDAQLAVAREYRSALRKFDPAASPSSVSFEGYITGRILLAAIERSGKDLDRERLIESFNGMSRLDVGGLTFSYSASNHEGSGLVFLTVIRNGQAETLP